MSFKDLVDKTVLPAAMQILGEEATYSPSSEDSSPPPDPFTVRGIWSGPHLAIPTGDVDYSTTHPMFSVKLSDFEDPPKPGDGLTLFGVDYEVIDIQLDGQGAASLVLRIA